MGVKTSEPAPGGEMARFSKSNWLTEIQCRGVEEYILKTASSFHMCTHMGKHTCVHIYTHRCTHMHTHTQEKNSIVFVSTSLLVNRHGAQITKGKWLFWTSLWWIFESWLLEMFGGFGWVWGASIAMAQWLLHWQKEKKKHLWCIKK